ncbi:hypothetical protein BDY19DRAFT_57172 [Irpex rosettiformis]|uniref:Uncharacterized protein n=1 Tax=Irpex rosettiformis TaxID=378272 RepID=A0ACB8ULF9_9APHY|nr:hypothetical protein BDY19DRAFT_57172 [Irpex rosettiformis]
MTPTLTSLAPAPSEEWLDADFDLPEGEPIHALDVDSDKEDEEDWDVDMGLGKTGGARVKAGLEGTLSKGVSHGVTQRPVLGQHSHMYTIRPPLQTSPEEDEEDESVPTIKAASLSIMSAPPPTLPAVCSSSTPLDDDDFEDGFALPSELTQLSLRPLDLVHRSSKSSMEWGDKDHTTSSQSSDTYSTYGFADHSSPSTAYTSASSASSLPDTEEEDECIDDDLLDGLVVPTGLFESGQSGKKLTKILETKKKTVSIDMRVKVARPDPEDDFESGLVLDDETELSPSRLLQNSQSTSKRPPTSLALRSKSVPVQTSIFRPPSRPKSDRAKSPNNPPVSSIKQLRRINAPPSPCPPASATRTLTYSQAITSTAVSSNSFLTAKAGLRGQKSHSGLKPVSAPPVRQLTRKASMPSLSDKAEQPSASGTLPITARYNAPTASSRAKTHASSTSRMHGLDFAPSPSRPSTPSSNPAAMRLTMPTTSSRMKARTPISAVFPNTPTLTQSTSPQPPTLRPSSSSSNKAPTVSSKVRHAQSQSLPGVPTTKVLKRPKRQQTYGDGTELDAFDDLPLDREKEGKYRVVPKGYGNRVPGSSSVMPKADSQADQGSLRRVPRHDSLGTGSKPMSPPSKTLKRSSRMELASAAKLVESELSIRKRKTPKTATNQAHRKPTLIRNLGGAGGPKVVGEMKWNPQTMRWEGNDQVLRDFDATVGTSTRPALITHLTGSSMGSPVNSFAAGARKVGNMIFDPSRMCWVSTLPPDEDEPDVFANLADDEDSDAWDAKADTIRANLPLNMDKDTTPSLQIKASTSSVSSRARSRSESESDRGSRASMICDVDDGFLDTCQAAEQRHRHEMRGWTAPTTSKPERTFLYEIRALATRQY